MNTEYYDLEDDTARNKIVWHYTSLPNLASILDSGLWASHILQMNDAQENEIGFSIIEQLLECNQSDPRRLVAYRAQRFSQRPPYRFPYLRNSFRDPESLYVACFSGAFDVLSQWVHYAGSDSEGIAIAFDRERLEQWCRLRPNTRRMAACCYVPPNAGELVGPRDKGNLIELLDFSSVSEPHIASGKAAFDEFDREQAEALLRMNDPQYSQSERDWYALRSTSNPGRTKNGNDRLDAHSDYRHGIAKLLGEVLRYPLPFIKHHAFQHEAETRIVCFQPEEAVHARQRKGSSVSYIKVSPWHTRDELCATIKGVLIAPGLDDRNYRIRGKIDATLRAQGISAPIVASTIPLRAPNAEPNPS